MKPIKKRDLPVKICEVCEKPFAWRKKWENVWEDVKYCSDKCRTDKSKNKASGGDFAPVIKTGIESAEIKRSSFFEL